ncbi:MAG: hypothetical protein ABSG65_32905 [Bryobacteraceae bacterium]|jgi:proteasome lid subunit RPN8/RPN11
MTLNDAFQGHSIRSTQLLQKGLLLLLALMACLMLVYRHHSGTMLASALALGTVVMPSGYVLARRRLGEARQRETEDRLMMHTRMYLRNEKPVREKAESDIELLARAIDGRKLPVHDFLELAAITPILPFGDRVVFGALPRRCAVGRLPYRRFADLAATLPKPACLPLTELLPAPATQEFGYWTAEPTGLTIEYSNAAMDEIRIRTAEGYQCLRHGGVEVGGILFGTRDDGVLRILSVRPIACEYAHGPRFQLSNQDETGLAELLQACAGDPALAGLEPAGYYHSHTREGICLSEADVQFFDRFFPLPWQVALIVRPAQLEPSRAGFFFREDDGSMRAERSYCEFLLT